MREKHPKPRKKSGCQRVCLFEWPSYRPRMPAEQAKGGVNSVMLGRHRLIEPERRRRCVCVHARARACARVYLCAHAFVHARACACASACLRDVFAIYDNNISPRLIMIIIKIIILYFIQIRHTDDFPSTGTRLVFNKDCAKQI